MKEEINIKFCENTIKSIAENGYFRAWNPDRVANRLNDYLNKEIYIGIIKTGRVVTIDTFYNTNCDLFGDIRDINELCECKIDNCKILNNKYG